MVDVHKALDGPPRFIRRTVFTNPELLTASSAPSHSGWRGRSSSPAQSRQRSTGLAAQEGAVRRRLRSNTTNSVLTEYGSDSATGARVSVTSQISVGQSRNETSREATKRLDQIIYERMVKSADQNSESYFVPIDQLEKIITFANVQQELEIPENKDQIAEIWSRSTRRRNIGRSSASLAKFICSANPPIRKIFAILCSMRKAYAIWSFLEENINDHDLPFVFLDLNGDVFRRSKDANSKKSPVKIKLFDNESWTPHFRDSFKSLQWRLLAPYFSLSYELKQKSRHQDLTPSTILPFVEDAPEAADLSDSIAREGGFSFVRKVRIHHAHYNHGRNTNYRDSSYFAVKELKSRSGKGLKEIRALMRFNEQPHEHLIRLLATYEHKGRLHMIFHWADGNNLENFWKETPAKPCIDFKFTQWMSKQIAGLAEAIHKIHHCDEFLLPETERGKTHGRHGDIKPANILWFRQSSDSFGILKISDFGFTEFHGPGSKTVPASRVVGLTNVYRAPEFDNAKRVSPRYDIWSFGCVLLEFAVWRTLGGYFDGIDAFSLSRWVESTAIIKEDNFFNLRLDDAENVIEAEAKPSVIKVFQDLRRHAECTGFISDLLECIEEDMLQLEPKDRARCGSIAEKLKAIHTRCHQDQRYCITRAHVVRNHRPAGLLERVPLELTDNMKALNLKSMAPNARCRQFPTSHVAGPQFSADRKAPRRELMLFVIIVLMVLILIGISAILFKLNHNGSRIRT